MDFPKLAPTLNGLGVTQTEVEGVVMKTRPATAALPTIDATKAKAILDDLGFVEENNGHQGIAQKHKVTTKQVSALHREMTMVKAVALAESQ